MRGRALAVVVVSLFPGPLIAQSEAGYSTVYEKLADCETTQSAATINGAGMFCLGVAAGISQMMSFNCGAILPGEEVRRLMSAGSPPNQLAAVQAFINWARANPQEWNEPFNVGMMRALQATFPCIPPGPAVE